jgi:competence protein CoiA
MLCGIRERDNCKVFANRSIKEDGPFYCLCKRELILRKGQIKIHHFAHKPPYSCSRSQGETEAHRRCKQSIYEALSKLNSVKQLDVEKDFDSAIADIFFSVNNIPIAIEIQRSSLSVNEIISRTKTYEKLGIYVLWLALFDEDLRKEKYSPKAWEKWCHAVYFGRVYYWQSDLTIIPIHFGEYQLYVEESTWYENGEEQSAGGYHKPSRRYKKTKFGKLLNLVSDFKPTLKEEWRGGTVYVPKCKIYSDCLKKWW